MGTKKQSSVTLQRYSLFVNTLSCLTLSKNSITVELHKIKERGFRWIMNYCS